MDQAGFLRLFLIRHGEAGGNAEGIMIGQWDVPRTHLGRGQARRTDDALARHSMTRIYTSPLRRAADIAAEIAARQGLSVDVVDDLRELNAGAAQRLRWTEVAERWPEFARRYTDGDRGIAVPWPEGECGRDVCLRVGQAIDTILRRHLDLGRGERSDDQPSIAIVAHGGVLAWAVHHLLKKPLTTWPRYAIPNASVSEFIVHALDGPADLIRLNDVSHLEGTESDLSP